MSSSSTAVDRPPLSSITSPPPIGGQHTAVEAARAVAEVQGAIVVAQQVPRNLARADAEMRRSCSKLSMAERAFFAFPRAGQQVTGASVHLARELARCWGNVQYGVTELSRDDKAGSSEMLAWAWDVEANTRAETRFIVRHLRDTRDRGAVELTDMRDIYENNANAGARRLREMIFAVLPQWFTDEAQGMCRQTLADGDGSPFEQRVRTALEVWAGVGVTELMLVERLQVPVVAWTPQNLATLAVLWQTIQRGESSVAAEFDTGAGRARLGDIVGPTAPAAAPVVPAASPAEVHAVDVTVPLPGDNGGNGIPADVTPQARADRPAPPRPPDTRPSTKVQQAAIRTLLDDLGLANATAQLVIAEILDGQLVMVDRLDALSRSSAQLVLDNALTVAQRLQVGVFIAPSEPDRQTEPSEAEQAAAFEAEQQDAAGGRAEGDPWGDPAGGEDQ